MQESAATLISKPAAELLNCAPVNNRGSPFQVGCTVIDGGLPPRFFGCQKPDEKLTRQPPQVRYASILNINGGWWSQPSRNQSDSDRTRGLGATNDMQSWAFVKKSLARHPGGSGLRIEKTTLFMKAY